MPGPEDTPGPRGQAPVRRLARPTGMLAGAVVFQLPFASVFAGLLHNPGAHQAPGAARATSRAPQRVAEVTGTGAAAASLAS